MHLTIDLPDDLVAAIQAQARAQGVSPDRIITRALEEKLPPTTEPPLDLPFETGYGIWAKYGTAPSAEEIDENRREMFRNFAKD